MVLWKSICYIFQHNCQKYYPQHRSNLLFWNLSHFVSFVILQNIYWKIYWNINKIFIARLINIESNFVTFVLFLFCWKLIMIWLQFLDYEIRQIWFLNSTEKVEPGFLLSLMCMFLNRTAQNYDLTAFNSKIQAFCRPEWTKGGIP